MRVARQLLQGLHLSASNSVTSTQTDRIVQWAGAIAEFSPGHSPVAATPRHSTRSRSNLVENKWCLRPVKALNSSDTMMSPDTRQQAARATCLSPGSAIRRHDFTRHPGWTSPSLVCTHRCLRVSSGVFLSCESDCHPRPKPRNAHATISTVRAIKTIIMIGQKIMPYQGAGEKSHQPQIKP